MGPRKKINYGDDSQIIGETKPQPLNERLCASQPASVLKFTINAPSTDRDHSSEKIDFGGFTQPAQLSDLFCPTQGTQVLTQSTSSSSPSTRIKNRLQRLVKRMTRFWVKASLEETDKFLHGLLEKMHYSYKCKPKGIFTIETQDRRGAILSFRCTLISVDHLILVDFRLSRGCGIEFKKH